MSQQETMTYDEHKKKHQLLHRYLDELVADFIDKTGMLPSYCTLMDLMKWSSEQTKNPTTVSKSLDRADKDHPNFSSVGLKFGFTLNDKNGKPICPTDLETGRLLKLPNAHEVIGQGASEYIIIFYVDENKYSKELVRTYKDSVAKVLGIQ